MVKPSSVEELKTTIGKELEPDSIMNKEPDPDDELKTIIPFEKENQPPTLDKTPKQPLQEWLKNNK